MVEKAKWKLLELPLPRKMVNQEQHQVPGDTSEIRATGEDLKHAGVVIPTHHSLSKRQMDLGE